jgi:hypothetical protein
MVWAVIGPAGAISMEVFTNWMLDDLHFNEHYVEFRRKVHSPALCAPMAAGYGVHSPVPMYSWQREDEPVDCDLLGRQCYSDSSFLIGSGVLALLYMEGSEAAWQRLERDYWERFGLGHHLVEATLWLDDQLGRIQACAAGAAGAPATRTTLPTGTALAAVGPSCPKAVRTAPPPTAH